MKTSQLPYGAPPTAADAFAYIDSVQSPTLSDLKLMVYLESYGCHAYADLANLSPHAAVCRLLQENSRDENVHAERLVKVIELIYSETFSVPSRAENPYIVGLPPMLTRELLETRARSEAKGQNFYLNWAANVSCSDAAQLLAQNAHEELRHAIRMAEAALLL